MKKIILGAAIALTLASQARASCDLCAVYVAQQVNTFHPGELTLGLAEQFTASGRLQKNGDKVDDPLHQFMNSSTTQVFGRYDLTDRLAIQANIPFISREFRRASEDGTESGSFSGLGDISLIGLYSPVHYEESGNLFRWTLSGGLKLPTGSYFRLREELPEEIEEDEGGEHGGHHDEMKIDSDDEMQTKSSFRHAGHHHGPVSGVHGHGLALGTGSWDVITGTNVFGRYGKWLTAGSIQYTFRNSGAYGYRYGNDFLWDIGFGRYLHLDEAGSVAIRFNLLGEVKDFDSLRGTEATDSVLTSLFMGPEVNFTAGNNVFGLVAVDIPTVMNNTETGVVAEYRLRLSVMYRF